MRGLYLQVGATALLAAVTNGQEAPVIYQDQLGRRFASHTSSSGVRYGLAIPEANTAPFQTILQITAPIDIGWAGFSWGGGMAYNPLVVTWANGNSVQVASRIAYSYSWPSAYTGATYKLLEGSYANRTHYVTTVLCTGCSVWDTTGAGNTTLNPHGSNLFAWAASENPVDDPSNVNTVFGVHQNFGMWDLDLSSARSSDFKKWATGNVGQSPTPSSSVGQVPTSQPIPVSSTSTSIKALPTSCGLQSRFPLRTASGWSYVKLAGSLAAPRGVAVDTQGNILTVEQGKGVTVHTLRTDGCIQSSKILINRPALNHGIALSVDGKQLLVSSLVSAFRFNYDPVAQTVSNEQTVVKGMEPGGHPTRTLVIPPKTPNLLVVSVGSNGNLDGPSLNKAVGRALVKVFDLTNVPQGGYDYRTSGRFLGYGLRNEVAIVVDNNNKVWGVENSADDFTRTVNGRPTDIHEDNPAEELNFLGDPSVSNEKWYGYPTCFTVWSGARFPDGNPRPGSQFVPAPNGTWTDARCEQESVPPRLSLQAHSAPIDGKFDRDGKNMYVTFHGSWNRVTPTGFKVIAIPFTQTASGEYDPVAAADSNQGYSDILWDSGQGCSMMTCFRPTGIAWDRDYTRMYIASDNAREGELYMLAKVT